MHTLNARVLRLPGIFGRIFFVRRVYRETRNTMKNKGNKSVTEEIIPHLGLREVNEVALVLGEILRRPFLLLALILEDLDLVFAAEIVAAAAAAHVRHYCGHASDGHRLPCPLSYSLLANRLVFGGEMRLRRR